MFKKIYRVGENRGKKRMWIEGRVLKDMGVTRGSKYSRTIKTFAGETFLELAFDGEGPLTVAGTEDRPIIDMCGKWVSEFVGDFTHYRSAFFPSTSKLGAGTNMAMIEIRPCEAS